MEKRGYTPEDVMNIGKEMHKFFMASLKVDDVIKHFSPEDIISKFEPEKRLSGINLDDIFKVFSTEEIEKFLEKKKNNSKK